VIDWLLEWEERRVSKRCCKSEGSGEPEFQTYLIPNNLHGYRHWLSGIILMALGLWLVDLLETVISGKGSLVQGYDTNSIFSRCGRIDPLSHVEVSSESGLP
jgi:hypothetical protein